MKKLLSALCVLALSATFAMATVPDATKCTVVPGDALNGLVIAPDSPSPITATIYTITVRNIQNDPIQNAAVVFEFGAGIRACTTATHSGTTNAQGVVVITLRGGGCLVGGGAGVIKANGITIRSYNNVKSPDWDGIAANGIVNISDLVNFQTLAACHDYDNNGLVNIGDLIQFSAAFSPQHSCTLVN